MVGHSDIFVRVVRGQAADPAPLHRRWTQWEQAVAVAGDGYIGATTGVSDDETFVATVAGRRQMRCDLRRSSHRVLVMVSSSRGFVEGVR
jgi:hypothetical protein